MLLGVGRIRIHPLLEPIGAFLDAIFGVVRVQIAEGVTKLAGGGALVRSEIVLRIAHLLLQLGEIVGQALAFIGELLRFLGIPLLTIAIVRLAETSGEGGGAWHLAELLLLIFFLLRQAIGFARHSVEAAVGVLLLRAREKILRFAETVRGAASFGAAGLGMAHIVIGCAQPLQGLRNALIVGILLARLACLSRLPGLT